MSKRTVGEKIVSDLAALGCLFDDELVLLAKNIDRAIRRAQAKAWDEGKIHGMDLMAEDSDGISTNPYRGRAKR